MPDTVPDHMTPLTLQGAHRFARCWKFTGGPVTLYFTDHDQPLVLSDGNTYTPHGGGSAFESKASGSGNFTARGILDSGEFVEADLLNGRWAGATVTEYLVDHRYPWAGEFMTHQYEIGEVRFNPETKIWEAESVGLLGQLARKRGGRQSRRCDFILGSTQCGVTIASFAATITVSSVTSRTVFVATPSAHDETGYFDDGEIEWTSGVNSGQKQAIKFFDTNGDIFTLQEAPRSAISVSDQATVRAGCNHLSGVDQDGTLNAVGDCYNKFNNLPNFGGLPFLPTNDKLLITPDAKTENS